MSSDSGQKAEAKENTQKAHTPKSMDNWWGKSRQWGTRVKPGKKGLTLNSLNVGIYGEIPEYWEDESRMPRGGYPSPGFAPNNPTLRFKYEQWSDSAADLYEEAIQRRWASATDVPWETLRPLPEDVERAMCQLCTELSQQATVEIDIICRWLEQLSFGFHEVKAFLAREITDAARHFEVFRKRALANGGGLGLESPSDMNRLIMESRGGWSEVCLFLYLLRGTFTFTLYKWGEKYAHNPAEKVIFGRCLQDKARHLSYGLSHLEYALAHRPEKAPIFKRLLSGGELFLVRDLEDPVMMETLAVILGGGVEGATSGMEKAYRLMGEWVELYLTYTNWLNIKCRSDLPQAMSRYLAA